MFSITGFLPRFLFESPAPPATTAAPVQPSDVASEVTHDINSIQPAAISDTVKKMMPSMLSAAYQILIIVIILLIGRKLINMLTKFIEKSLVHIDIDIGLKKFLATLTKVICYVILIFVIADRIGISSASIVAVLGSAGIAIGLALQGSLANFAGGIIILFVKPFKIGDYVICNAGEGVVTNIGLIYTTIVTLDNRVITLPNGSLSNGVVTNVTAKKYRRVDLTVGISYTSEIKKAKELMHQAFAGNEYIIEEKGITVYVDELADSAVILGGRAWCKTPDYWNAKWDVTETIKESFDKNSIEIPFNQIDVHVIK